MKKLLLAFFLLLVIPDIVAAIPNPASVYCVEAGYQSKLVNTPTGGQIGMCVFPDGTSCEEWQFYCKCADNPQYCWPGAYECHYPCPELPCKEAGEGVLVNECCEGLVEIFPAGVYENDCSMKQDYSGWIPICSDCGNGICEDWENNCNCPKDCGMIARPVFKPEPGTWASDQKIELSCDTPGASIHYTLDGSEPTESSPVYENPLHIETTCSIKGRAFRAGYTPSVAQTGTYQIKTMKGDILRDGSLDMKDVIQTAKMLSGEKDVSKVHLKADADGDGAIGAAEAVYILQRLCCERHEYSEAIQLRHLSTLFANPLIIFGEHASSFELQTVNEVVSHFTEMGNRCPAAKPSSEISEDDLKTYDLIVLGTADSNEVISTVCEKGCTTRLEPGFIGAVLEVSRNPWNLAKALLLISGTDELALKTLGLLLRDHPKMNNFNTEKILLHHHEIMDSDVYRGERFIDTAVVLQDEVYYRFDRANGELIEQRFSWWTGLPFHLPGIITQGQAEAMVDGVIRHTHLYFIPQDSGIFSLDEPTMNPCWVVSVGEPVITEVTVVDAVKGKIIGHGIPPP